MPLTPETRLREGDVVAVLATVTYAKRGDSYVHLKVDGGYSPLLLEPRQIHAVVRRSFKIGERVRHGGSFATIRAVDGDAAWIKLDGAAQPFTADLNEIELLDPAPEAEAEPLPPPVEPPAAAEPAPIEV